MSQTGTQLEFANTGALPELLNPLIDSRWDSFIEQHPSASIFHSSDWLRSLQQAFGYEPIVVTTALSGDRVHNGIPFCVVRSRLTGMRIVSLPFSDHCEILGRHTEEIHQLMSLARQRFSGMGAKYIEFRPACDLSSRDERLHSSDQFLHHTLDLAPGLETIFRSFHRDSVQRRITRAHKAGLGYEKGNSEVLLRAFYKLHIETRRRLGLPPFPLNWFHSLVSNLKERMQIRVAFCGNKPIASLLTLEFKTSVTYKYGASEARYHRLGAMPFLFWRAIEEAKAAGMLVFDFGRSEMSASGLLQFKRRWGTRESKLVYWQVKEDDSSGYERSYRHKNLAQKVFVHTPRPILVMLAKLYRHLG